MQTASVFLEGMEIEKTSINALDRVKIEESIEHHSTKVCKHAINLWLCPHAVLQADTMNLCDSG